LTGNHTIDVYIRLFELGCEWRGRLFEMRRGFPMREVSVSLSLTEREAEISLDSVRTEYRWSIYHSTPVCQKQFSLFDNVISKAHNSQTSPPHPPQNSSNITRITTETVILIECRISGLLVVWPLCHRILSSFGQIPRCGCFGM
jgi:hypothetical protein